MSKSTWKPFYFEGNNAWGKITSKKEWNEKIKKNYEPDTERLKTARILPSSVGTDMPRFGFYSEYIGQTTLGEWAAENGMTL